MKIALNISPLESGHKVRGTGFYVKHLKDAFLKYFPENEYTFFSDFKNPPLHQDVIHYPYFDPFFLTLPFINSSPIIITVHDLTPLVFPKYFPSGLKGKVKWQVQKMILKRSSAVITDSMSSKKDIHQIAGVDPDKISVIYLAAGEEFYSAPKNESSYINIRSKYNLPEEYALYVGDVTWNKNLPRLISAAIKTKIPLVMVGKALVDENISSKDPWSKDLITVRKLMNSQKTIIPLGFVPSEDLAELYRHASMMVLPSVYEGFGLGVLEAMQSGCPVVTTKEGSLYEVGGDAAFYIDPYDTDSISNGLRKVFNDKNLQKDLSVKGVSQAKKFSWRKTAQDTISVYRKAAK